MLNNYTSNEPSQLKVLIVDDVTYMRAIVKEMLSKLGFTNTAEAENGQDALSLIQQQPFNVVLCDWNMPKLSGIALLRAIRLSHDTVTLPFIMVTSNKKIDSVKASIDSGVSGFLIKPFSLEALAKQLDELYQEIALHRQTQQVLSPQISEALTDQSEKPKLASKPDVIVNQ